jgi:hypothetical protein
VSTANGRTKSNLPPDAAVQIRQLLKDRAEKIQEHNTKGYMDEGTAAGVGADGSVVVVMQSGRVWMAEMDRDTGRRSRWIPLGDAPLPDTPARETYDELMAMNRQLANLGHEDED